MPNWLWSAMFGGLVATLFTSVIVRRDLAAKAVKDGQWRRIQYGAGYKFAAAGGFFVTLGISAAATRASPENANMAMAVGLMFGLCTLLLIYEVFLREVRFNEREIEVAHPFMRTSIAFADVDLAHVVHSLNLASVRSGRNRIWVPLARGFPLLWRYGRNLERRQLFDAILRRGSLNSKRGRTFGKRRPLNESSAPLQAAAAIGAVARSWRTYTLDDEAVWPGETGADMPGRAVILLMLTGEAMVLAGSCRCRMRPGDYLVRPGDFHLAIEAACLDAASAKLLVIEI